MTSVSTFRNTGEKKYCCNWYKVNKSSLYLQKETSLLSSLRFPVILLLPCGKRGLSLFRPTLTTFIQQYIFKLIVQVAGRFFLVCHCCRFPFKPEEKHKFFFAYYDLFFDLFI